MAPTDPRARLLALASQQKAAAAQDAGKFKAEIVGVSIPQKKGDPLVFDTDEFVNRKTNAEALAGLRPAFDKAGTVTAGNASGINDGAAFFVLADAERAAAGPFGTTIAHGFLTLSLLPEMAEAAFGGHTGNDGSAIAWGRALGAALPATIH